LSLDGKLTVVTDDPGGLGLGIARELARNGATVIITSRNKSNLIKVCNLIDKNCYGFQLNVSKKRSLVKFIENISKDFSNIDILINNAGFPLEWKIWLKNVHDISEVEFMNIIQVDLIGSFRVTREIIKLIMKKRSRVIINIPPTPAISGHICGSPYSIAKAEFGRLTKHIALEYGQYNIRSYSVALGDVYTNTMDRSPSRNELVKAKNENKMKILVNQKKVLKLLFPLPEKIFLSQLEILLFLMG